LYSDADIERLLLLKAATDAGRAIGQVALWSDQQLRDLVREDRVAEAQRSLAAAASVHATLLDSAGAFYDRALAAVHDLDAQALRSALDAASLTLSPSDLTERLLVPLMRALGDGWVEGRLGIAHEHLASAIVRNVLSGIVLSRSLPGSGPGIVVATPARQVHELGALVVAATAASVGWQVTYLGSDLPAGDIATAATDVDARAVALSITHPSDDPDLPAQLRTLRESLAANTVLILGGLAASAYANTLTDSGSMLLSDMASLRAMLVSLRSENGGSHA
jgi:methylmalonyl-CoA mutase cobalamin-binding domain/chain